MLFSVVPFNAEEERMLEKVDLDLALPRAKYKEIFKELQLELNRLQRETKEAGIPLVVVFEGWEAAGKGTCINRLVQRLDPRGFKVHPISEPTEDERLRPYPWRFAIRMPARGRMAIFDRSWYGRVLVKRVEGLEPEAAWRRAYDQILQFERQHADDGAVIVKFWLHIHKKEQKRRFKKIRKDPSLAWKVGKAEEREHRKYDKYAAAVEEMLERTSTAFAPWTVVEATCGRYARVKVLETIIDALRQGLDRARSSKVAVVAGGESAEAESEASAAERVTRADTLLDRVDLSQKLEREEYRARLKPLQRRLRQLEHEMFLKRLPAVALYEGWDAAGKGGNIKRLVSRLDPRGYEVIPIAAPSKEELAHHYLWRFWRQIPKAGHLTIFDRSWYGRVMVERVEGFCSEQEWRRAYQEINEFERLVAAYGTVMVKFWIHISQDEQLRRFKEREVTSHKRWKLTDEDWRNREKYPAYREAVVEMIQRTSTTYAPWTIIAGDDKYFARVQALETVVSRLEEALEG